MRSNIDIPRLFGKGLKLSGSLIARIRNARRTQLYCVGAAKSGTHSIAVLFGGKIRAQHEPESRWVIRKILDMKAGRISTEQVRRYIRRRDRRLFLDIDSSHLNVAFIDILVTEFKQARFLLTIRDCYSWLDSLINHTLYRKNAIDEWRILRELTLGTDEMIYPREEQILKEHGLYNLDSYFTVWARHNWKVLDTVPADRLFVVRTDRISEKACEIADFTGLPRDLVQIHESHSFRSPANFGILAKIKSDHLERKAHQHCGTLMERFFPEIKTAKDAGIV